MVAVVVAAHVEQALAEPAVAGQEGGVLVVRAVEGEVALHQHGIGVDGGDLGDRGAVHHLGVGLGALGRSQHGAGVGGLLHEAAHLLAEVHVVHRHERAEPFARRAGQRAEHRAPDVVVRVGVQTVDAQHAGAVVEDDEVVGDGGDLDHPGTVAPQARLHGMTEPALDRVLIYHNTN